jgi:chromosome segregation ATPase
MTPRPSFACLLLAAALLAAGPARGQKGTPQTPAPDSVASQLVVLNRTLARIAGLLERQIEAQRLALSLEHLEFASRRVEPLEAELARARSDRADLAGKQVVLSASLEAMADQLEGSGPESLEALEAETIQAGARLKVLEAQSRELDRRILELENEVALSRQALKAIEDELATPPPAHLHTF